MRITGDILKLGNNKNKRGSRPKLWSGVFIAVVFLNLCLCSISQGVNTGTPLYIQEIGGSSVYSGIILGVFTASVMVSRLICGYIVDTRSRRIVIISGAVVILIGSGIPLIESSLVMQLPSRVLQGFGFAAVHTAISASAADVLPRERLGEGIGYYGLGQALAMALGPSLAIWLVGLDYTEALSLGFTSLAVAILLVGLLLRYEKRPQILPATSAYRLAHEKTEATKTEMVYQGEASKAVEKGRLSLFNRFFEKSALCGAIPALLMAPAFSAFYSYITMYAKSLDYANPSLFFIIGAITALVIRLASSKVLDSVAPIKVLLVPIIAGCLTLLGTYLIHVELVYYLFGIGFGISIGLIIPVLNSVVVKVSPPSRWGAANAFFFFMFDIGIGLGAIVWGFVLEGVGYTPIFVGSILCLIGCYIAAFILFPKRLK